MTWRCFVPFLLACVSAAAGQPVRHLFMDPASIQQTDKVSLHVNPPQRREIVIRPDQPWEQLMISFYLTVLDDAGKLRLWYICRDKANHPNVAYAESTDGIHWTKPNLGIVEYDGSKSNNLVGLTSLEGVVFRDPHAARAEEQYVYVTNFEKEGIIVRYGSPDGLHWQRDREPLLNLRADTQNVTFWDERLGCYVLYLRGWDTAEDWRERRRKVVRATAPTLAAPLPIQPPGKRSRITTELPTVFAVDKNDPPNTDVYNLSAQPYPLDPRWYVGFPSIFQRDRGLTDGRLLVQFTGSRDGITWHRYDRAAYAQPDPGENMAFMGTGLVVRGDELWQYGTGFHSRHGDVAARKKKTDGVIYRYIQRVDGFVSLDFGADEGRCVITPVKVDGTRLLLNVDAPGKLHVGLLDADGQAIPGYNATVQTNSTRTAVPWDFSALQGREVRLSLTGTRAKLYSFRFSAGNP